MNGEKVEQTGRIIKRVFVEEEIHLKNLLLVENNKGYQFDTEGELVKFLLGKNYYTLSLEEKKKHMRMNAYMKCAGTNLEVVELKNERIHVKNKFILYDEKTYVLSLVITGRIELLEHIDSNIYTKDLEKKEIKKNYIILSKFAEELLQKYVNHIWGDDGEPEEDEYPKAYREVYEILKHVSEEERREIAPEMLQTIERNMDRNYEYHLEPGVEFEDQKMLKTTRNLLALIYIKYWADEEERQEIYRRYNEGISDFTDLFPE